MTNSLSSASVPPELARQVLDLPMLDNEANAATVREYLIALLRQLWSDGGGFSGKRPFGNSDWEYVIYHAVKAGFDDEVAGTSAEVDTLIFAAIAELGRVS